MAVVLEASHVDVASPISSAPRPVSVPQFSRLTGRLHRRQRGAGDAHHHACVDLVQNGQRQDRAGTSAGASAASEVEQVTPSALMVTYSFSCTAS